MDPDATFHLILRLSRELQQLTTGTTLRLMCGGIPHYEKVELADTLSDNALDIRLATQDLYAWVNNGGYEPTSEWWDSSVSHVLKRLAATMTLVQRLRVDIRVENVSA